MAEPKFVIQGSDYPVPEWISFTMDESEILYDKAKMTLDQADEDLVFTPGLLSALMLIAYMRGNPGVSRKRAEMIIGAVPLADAIEHLAGEEEEEDAGPPSPAPSETNLPGESGSRPSSRFLLGRTDRKGIEPAAVRDRRHYPLPADGSGRVVQLHLPARIVNPAWLKT
jgi:hypothetical protein